MSETEDQQTQLLNQLFILSGARPRSWGKKYVPPKPKSKKGGFRPGSGRPKGALSVTPELRRVTLAITIPQWLADALTNMDIPPGRLIEAIIHFHLASLKKITGVLLKT